MALDSQWVGLAIASVQLWLWLSYGFGSSMGSYQLWLRNSYGFIYKHGELNNIEKGQLTIPSKWPATMASAQLWLWLSYGFGLAMALA